MSEEVELGLRRVEFDYKQILLQHLSNISKLVSYAILPNLSWGASGSPGPEDMLPIIEKVVSDNLFTSVEMLKSLLEPYLDDQYYTDIKSLQLQQDDDSWLAFKAKTIRKLGVLVKLMDRKDLLLEKTGTATLA